MKKLCLPFFLISLIPAFTFAAPSDWKIVNRIQTESSPKYFFRPVPRTPFISYTSGWKNYLIDQNTGEEISTWGMVDAIPSPDGKFVSIPWLLPRPWSVLRYGIPEVGEMYFYSTKKLLEGKGWKESLILLDKTLPGGYQTISILKETPKTAHYRIVTESMLVKKRLFLQEYKAKKSPSGEIVEMEKVFPNPRALCQNKTISMPMLSKSGKLFAAVDPTTRHMKVHKLLANGDCELLVDLKMPTGKVDFSFDDRYMAFHVSPVNPKAVAYILRSQSIENKINVMTYDFKLKKLEWVTKCQEANCYYPSWRPDGSLTFLRQPFDQNENYEFISVRRK